MTRKNARRTFAPKPVGLLEDEFVKVIQISEVEQPEIIQDILPRALINATTGHLYNKEITSALCQ